MFCDYLILIALFCSKGYLLYDQGYDVWMANVRGNTYSRKHVKYSTHHAKFWDFTFHEMGKYDIPSTIDYVLNYTGVSQIHYIGHSQGTVVFWIMASERPEYMDKVILMQALAPVAYLKHCRSPVVNFLAEWHLSVSVSFPIQLIPSTSRGGFRQRRCHSRRTIKNVDLCFSD